VTLIIGLRDDLIRGDTAHYRRGPLHALRIGLINNMPDAALQATEAQFTSLLEAAAADDQVWLQFSSLPEVPRSLEVRARLERQYWPLEALLSEPLDALIVTGAEPRTELLSQEPYWIRFCSVVDWAARHTRASIWSCLAAHAAVEYLDGIRRRRLPEKCCGLYAHTVQSHALTSALEAPLVTPQSRWNDLPEQALREAGYALLSASEASGVNVFARERNSLMVFLQGHPEYDAATLLKEYRRDVQRFLEGQYPRYPTMPRHYFGAEATARLEAYREEVLGRAEAREGPGFPYLPGPLMPAASWRDGAVQLYRNWLRAIRRL